MVGDMGSIVFPASHVMVSWMKEVEKKDPGYWNKRNTVGKQNSTSKSLKIQFFSRARLWNWHRGPHSRGSWSTCDTQ